MSATRPPRVRARFAGELVVDNFAGGGGASCGIEAALGRPIDIAINHDPVAIAMHKANHPETRHYTENIWEVDPREACAGRPVALAWFSPDCTHFSRAKGAQPVKKEIRGLAWVVIRWASTVAPRLIVLENVGEFATWGPLLDDGRPDPERQGETFRAFLGKLARCGYSFDFRELVAADYGAPTIRKRLYLIARRDEGALTWPDASHGEGREPWRAAAEVIDWQLPAPSIFGRKRELADATLRRIAEGVKRYVIDAQEPFIVRHGHYSKRTGAGLRPGCGAGLFRGQPLTRPLATVCATNDKHLVLPVLTKHYGGVVGHEVTRPLGSITARDSHALTAAFLTKFYGTSKAGASMRTPMPTITGQGNHVGEVRAFLLKYYGAPHGQHQDAREPLHTIRARDSFGLVEVAGQAYEIADIGMRMLQPHELYAAQGFPADYIIRPDGPRGKPLTKTEQTRLVGNSVCPDVAEALCAEAFSVAESRAA